MSEEPLQTLNPEPWTQAHDLGTLLFQTYKRSKTRDLCVEQDS